MSAFGTKPPERVCLRAARPLSGAATDRHNRIRDSVNDGEERAHTDAQYRRERFSELVEAERKARGLSDDVVKAKRRTQLQKLVAPVAGTVQQLSVHTVGGVVTPAQAFSWSCRRTAASRLRPWC